MSVTKDQRMLLSIINSWSMHDESDCDGYAEPLIAHLGMKSEPREPHESYMWDGKTFNSMLPERHILHDIAHWLVATQERRLLPDFGLGHGPESDRQLDAPELLPGKLISDEEVRASLLGVMLQHSLGMPCGLMAEEVGLDWDSKTLKELWLPAYQWLIAQDLITREGEPHISAQMKAAMSVRGPR